MPRKSGRYDQRDSQEETLEQISFTKQEGSSNMFITMTDNRTIEPIKEDFSPINPRGDSSQVLIGDYKNEETSTGNPLENLASENDDRSFTSNEKIRLKSKRSDTVPRVSEVSNIFKPSLQNP